MHTHSAKAIRDFIRLERISAAKDSGNGQRVEKVLAGIVPDQEARAEWLLEMQDEFLIIAGETLADDWKLTDVATRLVAVGTSRRDSPSAFSSAMRERVLKWAYDRSSGPDDKYDVDEDHDYFWFYGREITLNDLNGAAQYLQGHGLVTAHPLRSASVDDVLSLHVGITSQGRDCVEDFDGNYKTYIKSQEETGKSVSGTTINIKHLSGGNVVQGNGNTVSSVVGTQSSQQVINFGNTFKKVLPLLTLDATQQREAASYAIDLEQADDPSKVRRALEWIRNLALSSAGDTMIEMLSNKAGEILQEIF